MFDFVVQVPNDEAGAVVQAPLPIQVGPAAGLVPAAADNHGQGGAAAGLVPAAADNLGQAGEAAGLVPAAADNLDQAGGAAGLEPAEEGINHHTPAQVQAAPPLGPAAAARGGRGGWRGRPLGVRAGRRVRQRKEEAVEEIAHFIGLLATVPSRLYGGRFHSVPYNNYYNNQENRARNQRGGWQ